ncbi:MAG: TetR/AcrR family transcriptional regulator [Leptospiraceae bacterium]|nr:TetR/AcrR family transcriptional regulator [Leptospiraceae bacterium]
MYSKKKKLSNRAVKPKKKKDERHLKDKILAECLKIVAETGPKSINMREIARRLNISPMAAYRHFASKEALLSELGLLGFKMFNATLEKNLIIATNKKELMERFHILKKNYMEFAIKNPELYQIIFNSKLPNKEDFPELKESGMKAFSQLLNQIASMKIAGLLKEKEVFAAALFTHIIIHGYMSFQNTEMISNLKQMFQFEQDIEPMLDEFIYRALKIEP